MPGIRAILSALTVAGCAAALAACGGDDDEGGPIPQEAGSELIRQLDEIETLVEQGECEAAQQVAVTFASNVNELPDEVGGELRDGLVDAGENLGALTREEDQCMPATGASGETGELPPETTEEPAPTEEPTEPTTTEEEPPPEEDEGEPEGNGPPEETPGQGDPGSGSNEGGGNVGGSDDFSGGIGSDG